MTTRTAATANIAMAAPAPPPPPAAPVPLFEDEEHDPFLRPENTIVVDGLPNVAKDKCDKFLTVLGKVFPKAVPGGFFLPRDENGTSKPYVFITFHNPQDAAMAKTQGQGHKIDKTHSFIINSFTDFHTLESVSDTYEPPQPVPFVPPFMVHYGSGFELNWWDGVKRVEPHSFQQFDGCLTGNWSPNGRYFATFHLQGIALFGGEKFDRLGRLAHKYVDQLLFSPHEKYLLTASPESTRTPAIVMVYDTENFKALPGAVDPETKVHTQLWPIDVRATPMAWSNNDRYLARADPAAQKLYIYTVPEMTVTEIPMPYVQECVWSPARDVLAVWCREDAVANKPASVRLINPAQPQNTLATKNIFDVSKIMLAWHPQGDYLCALCRLHGRTKGTSLEVIHVRGSMPVYSVSLPTDAIACAWEPHGNHLAVLHARDNSNRPDCNIYEVKDRITLRDTLSRQAVSVLSWSPVGNYLCLFQPMVGLIEFYSVKDKQIVASQNHQQSMELAWDPSGRFVTSSVNNTRESLDLGFQIYNYRGDMVYHSTKNDFLRFLWRPRPPSLLTEEQQEEVKRTANFKRYEEEDAAFIKGLADKNAARRMEMRTSFEAWRERHAGDAARVAELLQGTGAALGWEDVEEEEIEEIEVREQVIGIVDDDSAEGTAQEAGKEAAAKEAAGPASTAKSTPPPTPVDRTPTTERAEERPATKADERGKA